MAHLTIVQCYLFMLIFTRAVSGVDGIGVARHRRFQFSSDYAYEFVAYNQVKTELSESQAEAGK